MASKKLAKRGTPRLRPNRKSKVFKAANRLLDEIIEDPDRFVDRVERTAESAARGIDRIVAEYERDPQRVKKELRTLIVKGLARLGKQRLNGSR